MMEVIRSVLSIDTIAIVFPGYPMSWLELVGTVFYLASVYLIARKSMWTWHTGIVSVTLYFSFLPDSSVCRRPRTDLLSCRLCLRLVVLEQKNTSRRLQRRRRSVQPPRAVAIWALATLVLSLVGASVLSRAHLFLPSLFPEPASWPLIDTLTTLMSFTAMFLMARKRTESWIYWIIVDVLGIWLYAVKEVLILSVLYVILLGLAIHGLLTWREPDPALDNAS